MKMIHMRQQQVLTWQDEWLLVVRQRLMKAKKVSRSMTMIFCHIEIFQMMKDISMGTIVGLLGKNYD